VLKFCMTTPLFVSLICSLCRKQRADHRRMVLWLRQGAPDVALH